jgi:iron complex outermembrane receptor protein
LKFNFAGGWEDTAAAGGDAGIDLMDRTAGMPGWIVVKPFVTYASNCIFPDYVVAADLYGQENPRSVGGAVTAGPAAFACSYAYTFHLDPVTKCPYVPNPIAVCSGGASIPPGYPGFDPNNPAINDGEGFAKNLSGHALPNAPPFTLSLGGEYSMPVSDDWVATLRGDFYWQADSWARIFNDNPYDRIRGYDTLNLSLILNSANGWSVMAYVKNVFDTTAITGDFLNSDDSGLTTNVFLTDPRLFGVRVTKQLDQGDGFWGSDYSGADFFTNLFSDADGGKPPLWIELGGQLEHVTGQGAVYDPDFLSKNPNSAILQQHTTPLQTQQPPLFSAGEEATISYQPDGSDWVISAAVRYGRSGNKMDVHHQTTKAQIWRYLGGFASKSNYFTQENFVDSHIYHAESHSVIDFMAGKDVGLGLFGGDVATVLSAGMRIAQYSSHSSDDIRARPDARLQVFSIPGIITEFEPYFHTYHAAENAARKFRGVGPSISWTGSVPVAGDSAGGFDFDWGANAAVLFGRQKTSVSHHQTGRYWPKGGFGQYGNSYLVTPTAGGHATNKSVTVPNIGGFAGLSYVYRNAKISFGYRADLFLGAIDGGIDHHHTETLNMGGPFATISFGLGG